MKQAEVPKNLDFDELLESSELLNAVQPYKVKRKKSALFGDTVRGLTAEEIETLLSQGNRSSSWSKVRVKKGFTAGFVHDSTFHGDCVLGIFDGKEIEAAEGVFLSNGVYRSTVVNSEIGDGALVHDAGLVSSYVVEDRAVVFRVGGLMARGECTFGNGRDVSLGIETGGREVRLYAEISVPVAWEIAVRRADQELQKRYVEFVDSYTKGVTLPFGVVASDSVVRFTSKVLDSWIGRGVIVDGALLIEDCTLLGADEEPASARDGAYVKHSCLQWGAEASSMAIVQESILTEHSRVERHAMVTRSIIGPNTSIGEGEVTSSLVGPFVGFHHQALLIAMLWPDGKGNIGYGANVGSNHTAKAPDQELLCGEGMFFGLGVNVKYPSDFLQAPYSIIATAVDTLPQRVEFPFSLINKPGAVPGPVSHSYNEIFPGWVLLNNIYTVRRNESKYRRRNKAKRTSFVFEVFRPDTVEKMVAARDRLRGVKDKKSHYTEKEIEGLGKNFLTEESREQGIGSYSFFIGYYALSGLKKRVVMLLENGDSEAVSDIYDDETGDPEWEYQKNLLHAEGLAERSVAQNLKEILSMHKLIAKSTEESKKRDDSRGRRIQGEYYDAHTEASRDSFVLETWEETRRFEREIEGLLAGIGEVE